MPSDSIAAPRPASTIILLRDGPAGPELFMVVRNRQIDFAGGALVFPGGRVDDADAALGEPFRIAAIREAFEETGLLLARRGGEMLGAHDLPREASFNALVAEHGLEPATDRLRHFAHWITPADVPKRFDTHFFLAEAPPEQIGLHDGGEAVDSVWITPEQVLEEAGKGLRTVVFPTRLNLGKLARYRSVAEAMEDNAPVVTVMPEPFEDEHGKWLRIPEEAGYGGSVFKAVNRAMVAKRG